MSQGKFLKVALPVRLRRLFDYRFEDFSKDPSLGSRVMVPLQKREVVGIVCGIAKESSVPRTKLRAVSKILDSEPTLTPELLALLKWAANYYHHPMGEVMQAAIPAALRKDRPMAPPPPRHYRLRAEGKAAISGIPSRNHLQRRALEVLNRAGENGLPADALAREIPGVSAALRRLIAHGWIERFELREIPKVLKKSRAALNPAQQKASRAIEGAIGQYASFLLEGVTGSGKTEVYLDCVEKVVAGGGQALVLVPEISLTPQLIARFRSRIGGVLAVLHSGLTESERHRSWWQCRQGEASVILGTRSAIFAPFLRPGLIIVDEEHDLSYKQKDGFRYSARDIAVKRAQMAKIPIVLGSATPSLETLANAHSGRYQHLRLAERAGGARLPRIAVIDTNHQPLREGLSPPVVEAIKQRLERKEQVLVFVNRRGFSPMVTCSECGWQADCRRCDARLTLHRRSARLICHHCGSQSVVPDSCPQCKTDGLVFLGEGTQRIEEALSKIFPEAHLARMDTDAVSSPERLSEVLEAVATRTVDILVGTQMLSKGHDFDGVTLVCVLSADQSLYSVDFRGPERLFQQLVQVSGRAGRRDQPGDVLIQTAHPQSETLSSVVTQDFARFAQGVLAERSQAAYPPFSRFVLLRAESPKAAAPMRFLRRAGREARALSSASDVEVFEPIPSPMERRAGRFRAQLLVRSNKDKRLHVFLDQWLEALESLPEAARVRWSIDVDPQEMF